jgi:hypothetical protein
MEAIIRVMGEGRLLPLDLFSDSDGVKTEYNLGLYYTQNNC